MTNICNLYESFHFKRILHLLITTSVSFTAALSGYAAADGPGVVTSIKPVHSLVSAVLEGVGEAHLIIRGYSSPHTFSMRPSDARLIQGASLIFYIGEDLETSLEQPIRTLPKNARVVELSELEGLVIKPYREGGSFEGHGDEHDSEHEEEQDEHGEEVHDDHGEFDLHLWLDPENAKLMTYEIESVLSEVDSVNAETYRANAKQLIAQLDQMSAEIDSKLAPVRNKPFLVFHDAYRYFEDRFDVNAVGSAVVTADRKPSAKRISELRDKVEDLGVVCVFAEPQFDSKLVNIIVEGTSARIGTVDPIGANLDIGPGLYFKTMQNMADSFVDCLEQ